MYTCPQETLSAKTAVILEYNDSRLTEAVGSLTTGSGSLYLEFCHYVSAVTNLQEKLTFVLDRIPSILALALKAE